MSSAGYSLSSAHALRPKGPPGPKTRQFRLSSAAVPQGGEGRLCGSLLVLVGGEGTGWRRNVPPSGPLLSAPHPTHLAALPWLQPLWRSARCRPSGPLPEGSVGDEGPTEDPTEEPQTRWGAYMGARRPCPRGDLQDARRGSWGHPHLAGSWYWEVQHFGYQGGKDQTVW